MISLSRMTAHRLLLVPVVFLLVLAGCSGDGPSDPDDDPTPAISITVGASTLTLEQGEDGTVSVSVSRSGGFDGAVTLSVDGLPSGVTTTGGQIAAGSTTASLAIAASAAASVGTASATVRAVGTGVATATAGLSIQVTEAPTGGFSLSVDPGSLTIQQGAAGQSTLSVARTAPFDGAVEVTPSAPSGITVGGLSSPIPGDDAAVSVTVDAGVTPGSYPITLAGAADGVAADVATLQVEVTAAPAGSDFAWAFCDDDPPIWMAVQDGSGAWQRITPSGGLFPFSVSSARVQVAAVWDRGGEFETVIFYLARPEASLTEGVCPTYRAVTGSVVGLTPGQFASATLGHSTAFATGTGTVALSFDKVIDGAVDFFASLSEASVGGLSVQSLFLQRDVDPAPGASVVVDFTGPDAFAPAMIDVTATNLGGDVAAATTTLLTPTVAASVFAGAAPGGGPTWTVPVVPQDRLRSGDMQGVALSAIASPTAPTLSRGTVKYFSTVADQSVTLGPFLGPVAMSAAATAPYVRFRAEYTRQPEYMGHLLLSFGQLDRDLLMWVTDDWLDGASSVDLTVPDLGGVDGWLDLWGLTAGASTTWTFNANGWDGVGGIIGPDVYTDGLEVRSGIRVGSITP